MSTNGIDFKKLKISKLVFDKFYKEYLLILQNMKLTSDDKIDHIDKLVRRHKNYKILFLATFITAIQSIEVNYNRLFVANKCYCLQHEFVKLLCWYTFQKNYIDQEDTPFKKDDDAYFGAMKIVSVLYASYIFIHGTNAALITNMFETAYDRICAYDLNVRRFMHTIIEVITHTNGITEALINSPIHSMHGKEEAKEDTEKSNDQMLH